MKTNNELGAVYLEVEGLDKERFKELTKGMKFFSNIDFESKGVENYGTCESDFEWLNIDSPEPHSRKITLDELEELLYATKPKPTHFAISPEDYKEYQELKKLKDILKYTFVYCMQSNGAWHRGEYTIKGNVSEFHYISYNGNKYIMVADDDNLYLAIKNY